MQRGKNINPAVLRMQKASGFTLVELLVVLAIIALLLTIAVPRYFNNIERGKEAALRQDLYILRENIDKFYGDQGRYPKSLDELVEKQYIRSVPVDPITNLPDSWVIVPPPLDMDGQVYDVQSGAVGNGQDGKPYAEW